MFFVSFCGHDSRDPGSESKEPWPTPDEISRSPAIWRSVPPPAPPSVSHGIHEAREAIRRIKAALPNLISPGRALIERLLAE